MLITISQLIIGSVDLIAAFLLMFGLWRMASPVTAPSGILVAGVGMLAAVAASFLYVFTVDAAAKPHLPLNIGLAAAALLIGAGIAWWSGRKVAITAMPQAVALFNGMGGGAAGAIAAVELFGGQTHGATQLIVTLLGALIGSISLSGSIIAWAKLDALLKKPLHMPGLQILNGVVLLLCVLVGGYIVFAATGGAAPLVSTPHLIEIFFAIALVYGILMTLPIGGADMPVVISVYNAFTGLAVGLEGYVLHTERVETPWIYAS
jgi:NAD(P) transhydrogenase subunit beta